MFRFRSWNNVHKSALIAFFTNFYVYLPLCPLYFQRRGLNLFEIASLTSIIIGVQLLGEVPTGVFADRAGRKASFLLALFIQFLGEVFFLFARTYWEFALIQAFAALGFCFMSGAAEALIYDSLPADGRPDAMKRAMGIIGATARVSSVLAFALSGLLAVRFSLPAFLFTVGVTAGFVFVAFMVGFTLEEPSAHAPEAEGGEGGSWSLLAGGVRLLRGNARLRRIVGLSLFSEPFGWYQLTWYGPYLKLAGTPGAAFGAAVAAGSLLGAAGERFAYRLEGALGVKRGILLATALPGVLYLLLAGWVHPVASPILFCLLFGATSLRGPLLSTYSNGHIEGRHRATVLSLLNMAASAYLSLMGLAVGAAARQSLPLGLGLMGALVLAGALLFRIDERHLEPAPSQGEE